MTPSNNPRREHDGASRSPQPETQLENLCTELIHRLADEITKRVIDGIEARDRERDRAGRSPLTQLLSLDQLVATLPAAKKPATWKRWLYEKSRHGHIPGCVKLGGALYFRAETAHQWLQAGAPPELARDDWISAANRATVRTHEPPNKQGHGKPLTMARGSIVKRPSGSYAIRYWDHNGQRRYETAGTSRAAAEQLLTTRLAELQTGNWRSAASEETLASYTSRWLERRDPSNNNAGRDRRHSRSRLSAATHREYRRSLELHVQPTLGKRPLRSIRPIDIDDLIAKLERQGLAPGTIRNTIAPLRKLLADAVRQQLIPSNPAARPDLPPEQEFAGKEIPQTHTDAIRHALHALARPNPHQPQEPDLFYLHLFDVALGTGLRLGELRALRWTNIDRNAQLIRVEYAYSRDQLKRPKSVAGIRSIPIFPSVRTALDQLAARALEHGRYAPNELIFANQRGTPLQPSNLNRRVWQPALRHARLTNDHNKTIYRFHDLRHTCISRLVAAGADIKLVQAIAGHANPLITLQRYSHLNDTRLTEAAHKYDPSHTHTTTNNPTR